ncbi:uncharacterized protein [Rutidosis leptorrhynchoides]|uniref:uncharacterized protein n=1 Tax=Rutidosis leptorrhynchoides TaxID=125765 RepID=UPI003A9957BD
MDISKKDSWSWNLASSGTFTVKKLTKVMEDQIFAEAYNRGDETIRNYLVQKKIEIFAWRALKRRLPVRTELDKRGIYLHSVRCPLCDDSIETIDHTLIFCKHANEVWSRVFKWWNFGTFSIFTTNDLLRVQPSQVVSAASFKIWQAVVWISAYLIWKNQNNKAFRDKCWNAPMALNEIQVLSFEWITHRTKGVKIEWFKWLSNPNIYVF